MHVNSVSNSNTAPVNSKALLSIKNAGRFNPAMSESSYKLLKTFDLDSWGIKTLCEKYDVKAVFKTSWFQNHPQYRPIGPSDSYTASYAQVDLYVKKVAKNNGLIERIKRFFEPWQKISYGEYSDIDARRPLSNAEEKLANVVKRLTYANIKSNLQPADSKKVIIEGAFYEF